MKGLLLSFLLLVYCPGNAQSHLYKTIDSIATNQQWVNEIPGFIVGVIKDDKVIFKKAYGLQRLSSVKKLDTQSDFHMASVSKPFAATAIMQLVEKNKIHLDSTLIHYLPYFKMKDPAYKKITILHILTHSSGIPDVTDYQWDKPYNKDDAAEKYAKSFVDMSLDFDPGERFSYSNAGFDILAAVIEKVSGKTFEQYIEENIFIPASMNNSSFLLSDIPTARRTSPHIIDNKLMMSVSKVYPYNRIHAPSSTLHSDMDDMLQWAKLQLRHGTNIIQDATWSNMLTPRVKVDENFSVCLSWFETKLGDKTIYFHSGGDLGYRSFVGFCPSENVAVVLMGNNNLFDAVDPAIAIFRSLLMKSPAIITPKPIYLLLKKYILTQGIKKVKEIYNIEKEIHPVLYKYDGASVVPLADLLYSLGHTQQSIDVLQFCTEIEPANIVWYEYLGDVYAANKNKMLAAQWYNKALSIDPTATKIKEKINKL